MQQSSAIRPIEFATRWRAILLAGCCWLIVVAQSQAGERRLLKKIHVEPTTIELRGTNRTQQVIVSAERDDGRLIDVTHQARLENNHAQVIRIEDGLVVGVADGETQLRVTCDGLDAVVPVRVRDFAGMYIYIYIYIYVYTHIYTYIYIYIHTYTLYLYM